MNTQRAIVAALTTVLIVVAAGALPMLAAQAPEPVEATPTATGTPHAPPPPSETGTPTPPAAPPDLRHITPPAAIQTFIAEARAHSTRTAGTGTPRPARSPIGRLPPRATMIAVLATSAAAAQATAAANPPESVGHLLDPATGEVHRLWAASETGNGQFSPDGRWFTYAAGPDHTSLRVQVADLSVWPPVVKDLGPGSQPRLSPDASMVASSTGWGETPPKPRVVVKQVASGETLATFEGYVASWSPNSRWLTYASLRTESDPVEVRLADTSAWRSRTLYQFPPYPGDNRLAPHWSPDGGWLAYSREKAGDSYWVDPHTLTTTALPGFATGWVDATRVRLHTPQGPAAYDVTTGASVALPQEPARDEGVRSPDGSISVRRAARQSMFDPTMLEAVLLKDGSILWTAPGEGLNWSPDSAYFAFTRRQAETNEVIVATALDGKAVLTLPGVAGLTWSPTEAQFLYAVSEGREGCFGPNGNHQVHMYLVDLAAGTDSSATPAFTVSCRTGGAQIIWAPSGRHVLLCTSCGGM